MTNSHKKKKKSVNCNQLHSPTSIAVHCENENDKSPKKSKNKKEYFQFITKFIYDNFSYYCVLPMFTACNSRSQCTRSIALHAFYTEAETIYLLCTYTEQFSFSIRWCRCHLPKPKIQKGFWISVVNTKIENCKNETEKVTERAEQARERVRAEAS